MTDSENGRLHLRVAGGTHAELGGGRGEQLGGRVAEAYEAYAELFRIVGVSVEREREAAERTLQTLEAWRPQIVTELRGIADAAGQDLLHVAALNARTEILALGTAPSHECSTLTAVVDGRRHGVQTWDWHVELDPFWHTHEVAGPGLQYAGISEHGVLSKIGVNEAGLALHFNILGHRDDGPGGVPMHVLSSAVLSECASVDAAVELIRQAPVASSSAFTLVDATRAVSVEMSPAGVFEILEQAGSVQRTNHFQHETPLGGQRSEAYEPDSSERLALVRSRLAGGPPADVAELVGVLVSGEGEAPLTCVADPTKSIGERWETLATVVTDPERRTIRILDGKPTEAASGSWRTLAC